MKRTKQNIQNKAYDFCFAAQLQINTMQAQINDMALTEIKRLKSIINDMSEVVYNLDIPTGLGLDQSGFTTNRFQF